MDFGRGLDERLTDRFVGMYVNDLTRDYGDRGRQAIEGFSRRVGKPGWSRESARSSSWTDLGTPFDRADVPMLREARSVRCFLARAAPAATFRLTARI